MDEAAHGVQASLDLAAAFGRSSYDGDGATVIATVHYGQRYDNAFWNGTQLVFGDGDGRVFERFTKPVDVLGHEFAHAVTEHTAGLVYQDQPGALNESFSDVFAACLKQRLLGQQAGEGDWLIGAGLFVPGIEARALRDMAAPGTAYDDPVLGRDPQVGHLDDFVVTEDDNGGVHLNSGIPNRAFHLAATAVGGTSWEGAGRIWWAALTGGAAGPRHRLRGLRGDHRRGGRRAPVRGRGRLGRGGRGARVRTRTRARDRAGRPRQCPTGRGPSLGRFRGSQRGGPARPAPTTTRWSTRPAPCSTGSTSPRPARVSRCPTCSSTPSRFPAGPR